MTKEELEESRKQDKMNEVSRLAGDERTAKIKYKLAKARCQAARYELSLMYQQKKTGEL